MTAKNTIPLAQMGSIPMITFSSSTCVTVQSLHGFDCAVDSLPDGTIAALSKNLKNIMVYKNHISSVETVSLEDVLSI